MKIKDYEIRDIKKFCELFLLDYGKTEKAMIWLRDSYNESIFIMTEDFQDVIIKSMTTFQNIVDYFKGIREVGKFNKISFSEHLILIKKMSNAGIKGSEAGTNLENLIIKLKLKNSCG